MVKDEQTLGIGGGQTNGSMPPTWRRGLLRDRSGLDGFFRLMMSSGLRGRHFAILQPGGSIQDQASPTPVMNWA